ncbi:MAG: polyketide cyclase [Candidatus Peribacteria bacterium]|nr:polyketide cyclase [Candidatus Peribacteria bacterium]
MCNAANSRDKDVALLPICIFESSFLASLLVEGFLFSLYFSYVETLELYPHNPPLMSDPTLITVEVVVHAPVAKVWQHWTEPEHIMKWNNASDDWHTPSATNDLREGGTFNCRMEAKDGSMGFDFGGTYTKVVPHKQIEYTIGDGRKVAVSFEEKGEETHVVENFEAETMNSVEMQRGGWQAILNNFKAEVEGE